MKKLDRTIRGVVLADGEVTGHQHVVADYGVELFELENGTKKLVAENGFTVTHEEHLPLTIETAGDYTVSIVKEYDHLREEARNVID